MKAKKINESLNDIFKSKDIDDLKRNWNFNQPFDEFMNTWKLLNEIGIEDVKPAVFEERNSIEFRIKIFSLIKNSWGVDKFLLREEAEYIKKLLEKFNYEELNDYKINEDHTYLRMSDAKRIISKRLYKIKDMGKFGKTNYI